MKRFNAGEFRHLDIEKEKVKLIRFISINSLTPVFNKADIHAHGCEHQLQNTPVMGMIFSDENSGTVTMGRFHIT